MRSGSEDLTTRARIRDAAVQRYTADGLTAPLRAIAADAGVSPGLILHHFGSGADLRAACDEHVLAEIKAGESQVILSSEPPTALLAYLAQIDEYVPLVGYVLRCLREGGDIARDLIDGMVDDAVDYLADGVRAGTVSPSRDPEARARLLTTMALGSLLLSLPAGSDPVDLDDLPAWFEDHTRRMALPTLELATEPVLTDSSLLDTYLAATDATPTDPETPDRST